MQEGLTAYGQPPVTIDSMRPKGKISVINEIHRSSIAPERKVKTLKPETAEQQSHMTQLISARNNGVKPKIPVKRLSTVQQQRSQQEAVDRSYGRTSVASLASTMFETETKKIDIDASSESEEDIEEMHRQEIAALYAEHEQKIAEIQKVAAEVLERELAALRAEYEQKLVKG